MADFNIVIKVDSSGAVRGAKNVENGLKRVENRANKVEQTLKRAFAGVAAGQGAVQSVKFLANFSQAMSTVKAISKANEEQFKSLREEAIRLGTTTRFTATQAAEGMLFLARSGYETNEILQAIPGTLNLAQAGALQLGRAADIATNILKGFGLETTETARVVDVLALAANSANTTVEQMGQAMKFVAPIAAGVRMSVEETAGAIQVLSNAGIQASMAGTALRRVIGALEGPTVAQRKVLASLGLTADDVKVSQIGLAQAIENIRAKTNDVGVALRLFGQRGGPAAEVMGKVTQQMIDFGIANEGASGTAQRIANIMDDNLNGAILRVKSAFQGFLILLGDVEGVSVLREILEGTAKTFRFLATHAEQFNDVIKVVISALVLYSIATGQATAATKTFGAAIATHPLGTLLVIITSVIAAFTLLREEITLGGEGMITFGDIFRVTIDFINDAWNAMTGGMGGDIINLRDGWVGLVEDMANFFLAMLLTLAQGFDKLVGFFEGLWKSGDLIAQAMAQSFYTAWVNIKNGLINIVGDGINWLIDRYNSLAGTFKAPLIAKVDTTGILAEHLAPEAIITGEQIGEAFNEGLNRTAGEDVILGIIDEAERRKLEEMRRLGQLEPEAPPTPTPQVPEPIFGPEPSAGGRGGPTFRELLNNILMETELLKLNSREMEIQQGLLQMQDQLKRKLTITETFLAQTALTNLQKQQEMAQAYDEIIGPMEDVIARQEALNSLYQQGKISLEQYQQAMDETRITALNLNTDMQSGLERGLLRVKQNIQDVASVAENTLTNAFRSAEDALVQFTTTGEINFSQLVDGILQDLTRLLIRKALLNLIPGLGPAAGAVPGFATGGQFNVGGSGGADSQRVAFDATPGERVTVETPAQQRANDAGGGAAPANIKIVNVTDPNEISEAMSSREGEQVILNTISRNPSTIRNSLA